MRELILEAPQAGETISEDVTDTAATIDLLGTNHANLGKSLAYVADVDLYIIWDDADDMDDVTAATGAFVAAGTMFKFRVSSNTRFASVLRAGDDNGTIHIWRCGY